MKRHIWVVMLIALMTIALTGCGKKQENGGQQPDNSHSYTEYTIIFDLNTTPDDLTDDESFSYWTTGWNSQKKKSVVKYAATDDAYILSDDVPVPTRKGYYFAGWQTKPVITEADIVYGVSKYQMFFDTKISRLGLDAIKTKTEKEIADRGIAQEVNYIKDMENLTEDGTVTFYARWVEAKEISTAEDLKNIANDLYGAYVLVNDIELTGEWNPIGKYYTNYEYYNIDWWTYAFRGTLDGNGHSIKGLVIKTGQVENPGYADMKDARWYADGPDCDGAAGLFGAACKATFKNITIESPVIDITGANSYTGDHLYVASLCCFDMGSAITSVTINNPTINVEYSDEKLTYVDTLFTVVSGLEAGSWSTTVSGCSVNGGKIALDYTCISSHGGEVYVGGMLGECYSSIKTSNVETSISVNGRDICEKAEDVELVVNVGGVGAANAAATSTTAKTDIVAEVVKTKGAASVNIGGFAGAQRYQQVQSCEIETNIITNCKLDNEKGQLNVGAVLGRMDLFYASLILKYADEVKCGCQDNTINATYQGEPYDIVMADGGYPTINGEKIHYIATVDFTKETTNAETGATTTVEYHRNLDQVVEKYGSYLPKEGLDKKIMFIVIK